MEFVAFNEVVSPCILEPGKMYKTQTREYSTGVYVFSNDGTIPRSVLEDFQEADKGMALHLGSGAMFSLIDMHELWPVLIDRDKKTVVMQKVIEHAITNCATVKDAKDTIISIGEKSFDLEADRMNEGLMRETMNHQIGRLHWTKRFSQVKEALNSRPPTYVLSDLRDKQLIGSLQLTSKTHGPIQFLNLTNVHNHMPDKSMDFIKSMPLSEEATILYSDWSEVNYSACGTMQSIRRGVADITTYLNFTRYAMLDR